MPDEKDGGWMKELANDLRLQFHERLSSPLIGSFAISWLIWNYRLLAVLFSSMSVEERFRFIDTTLYPNHFIGWWKLFVGPLLCALVYIFVYPHPSKWINGYWLRRQLEAKKQRDEIDGATLLTREEMAEERKRTYQRVRETEEENRQLREELQASKTAIADLTRTKEPAPASDDPLRREAERRRLEIEAAEAELKLAELREQRAKTRSVTPSDPLANLPEGTRQLLKHMAEKNGSIREADVKPVFPNENSVRVESFVDRALELELIRDTRGQSADPTLFLTPKGRKYVVNHKLI